MPKHLTQEQKDAAQAKAKATRKAMIAPDALAVVAEFTPAYASLENTQRDIVKEVGAIVANMIEVCDTPKSADGKAMLLNLIKACTSSTYLRQISGQWAGAILGDQDVLKITGFKELSNASKLGNAAIGVEPRGRREKTGAEVQQVNVVEVWPLLDTIIQNEAGRAALRRFLNQHGFEMTPLAVSADVIPAQVEVEVERPVIHVSRKVRKVA